MVRPTTTLFTVAAMLSVLLAAPGTANAHDASCTAASAPSVSVFASLLARIDFLGLFVSDAQGESDACPDKFEDVVTKPHRDWKVEGEVQPASGPGNANAPLTHAPCVNGKAADMFPCKGVDMMSHVSLTELGIDRLNDIWGWTDSTTKKDYALVGATTATVFVDITDSKRPKVLGMLPSAIEGAPSTWRDIKVYDDHAFIVSEHANHGMQVFDLTRLRDWDGSYTIYDADARYTGHGSAHNININPETGFAYSIGSRGFSSKPLPFSLVVDAPSSAAGSYLATGAAFGPAPTQTGLSGPIVAAVDTAGLTTACQSLVGFPAGSIALVDRGGCNFTVKVKNAQDAGATGVVVANHSPGYLTMGGTDPTITIPSVFISQTDGATLRAGLPASGTMLANDPPPPCGTGLHMIDIRDPKNPTFAGCDDSTGYVHDTQCVVYRGPDAEHRGKELCFNSNGYNVSNDPDLNWLSIVDVSDKSNPVTLSMVQYEGSGYSHQAWLTEDQRFLLHGDEGDETLRGVGTTTRVWDVRDLDNPSVKSVFESTTKAIDHNIYTQGRYAYGANYTAGLRVYDMKNVGTTGLTEVAFFDTYPENDAASFEGGPWSNYPYFRQKGIVAVSSVDRGLFVLRPHVGRNGN